MFAGTDTASKAPQPPRRPSTAASNAPSWPRTAPSWRGAESVAGKLTLQPHPPHDKGEQGRDPCWSIAVLSASSPVPASRVPEVQNQKRKLFGTDLGPISWIQHGPSIWWYWACSVVAQFGQVYAELCFGSDNEFCFRPSFPLHHKRARKGNVKKKT